MPPHRASLFCLRQKGIAAAGENCPKLLKHKLFPEELADYLGVWHESTLAGQSNHLKCSRSNLMAFGLSKLSRKLVFQGARRAGVTVRSGLGKVERLARYLSGPNPGPRCQGSPTGVVALSSETN
jgi:hypothetical protein